MSQNYVNTILRKVIYLEFSLFRDNLPTIMINAHEPAINSTMCPNMHFRQNF